jgi:hypothetical protein
VKNSKKLFSFIFAFVLLMTSVSFPVSASKESEYQDRIDYWEDYIAKNEAGEEDVQKLLQAGKPLQVYHCEEMPEYPGGTGECVRYMMNEAVRIMKERNIPVCHGCCGIPGRTIIRFVIDKEGNVTSPEVLRGVDPVLDKIGLEVIKSMPKWKPGKVEGKPVPCIYVLPVMYELQ